MLETLHIRNYALIDELEVEFRPGFNVLTGETGAGKSIIVDALNLVLGARASSEVVRDGAPRAKIDALFRIKQPSRRLAKLLEGFEIELDEGELLLSRTVNADGRSRAHAAGALVPVSVLAAIGDELVDLHGQHEHQSLLKPDRQLDLLDAYAGLETAAQGVADAVDRLRELQRAVETLETNDRERARRLEFLRFEVTEINAARLEPDEEETLKARRNLITNAEKIVELASHAYGVLYEDAEASAAGCAGSALNDLEELAGVDNRFQALVERLDAVRADMDEIVTELRQFTDQAEYDPQELESLNQRITLISGLKRKYGESVEEVLAYRDKAAGELEELEQHDQRLEEMQAERNKLLDKAQGSAQTLSRKRKTAARRLDKEVATALQDLGMKGGRFETRFEAGGLTRDGIDRVAFMLCANPGEKLRPLRQVASGGEISRVMLAVKTVFADSDKIPTLIFDEIDAGVGGAVATKVAGRLRDLARSHQTISITHIPQIAAAADTHYRVTKSSGKGRAKTAIAPVEGDARIEELARILDGSVSDVSLAHARSLLGGKGA